MVHDTVAGGTGIPDQTAAHRLYCLEYRDDLSAQLRTALSPGSTILPASAPAVPIGDADAEFLRSVLGPDWDRIANAPLPFGPDRAELEALGPREARLGLLWAEALVAVSRMLSEDGPGVDDERIDARRLLSEILGDALGRRCAITWMLDAWLRLCESPADPETVESLRHAVRLAESGGWVERQSVLLLASVKLASSQDPESEINDTVERLESRFPHDRLRCAALIWHAGATERAVEMVRSVLEETPDVAVELLCAPRYQVFGPDVRRFLGILVERTRGVVRQRSAAVAELHAVCNQMAAEIGSPFVAIADTVQVVAENLDLRTGKRLGVALAREWDETHGEWSEKLRAELDRSRAELTKLERFLNNAYKERDYWAANVASVEEEAKTHGYALHAYGVFGLFQGKKRRRSEQMRAHYEQCRLNLDQAENLLRQQENRARFDIQNLVKRVALLETFVQRISALTRPA